VADEPPIDRVLPRLKDVRPEGGPGSFVALCPAHEDRKPSLSVRIGGDGRVLCHCFAGCTFDAVVAATGLEKKDFFPGGKEPRHTPDRGVTVAALAWRKRLPEDFLRSLGLADKLVGSKYEVLIPYRDESGAELFVRERKALKAKDGSKQPAGQAPPLRPLAARTEFRARPEKAADPRGRARATAGRCGTTDTRRSGFPARRRSVRRSRPTCLAGFADVLVWQEKDRAASEFVVAVAAAAAGAGLTCRVLRSAAKDPADLHAGDPEEFEANFDALVAAAVPAAGATTPAGAVHLFKLSDTANAERLVRRHGIDLRHCEAWGQWLVWDGRRWRRDDTGEVTRRAMDTAKSIFEEVGTEEGEENQKRMFAHWQRSQNEGSIRAMVRLAAAVDPVPVRPDDLDANPWLFNCPNGTIDLRIW
jgi:putative DNA primase/helicase